MDKKKSRTDLLAAGRQKLQQFRQKKDGKGNDQKKDGRGSSSHGKSSKKPSKSEQHEPNTDTSSSISETAVNPQVAEGAPHVESDQGMVDSSMTSTENTLVHDADVSAVAPSSEPHMPKQGDAEVVSGHEAELKQQAVAAAGNNPIGGDSSPSISNEEVGPMASAASDTKGTEKEIKHAETPEAVDASDLSASGDIMEGPGLEVEKESINGEKEEHLLPPCEDIPDVSLIQARGDQEADGSCLEQSAKSLEKMDMEKAATEAKQKGNGGSVSISTSASSVSKGFSIALASCESGINSEIRSQQREEDVADSSNEENSEDSESPFGTGNYGQNRIEKLSAEAEDRVVADASTEQPLTESICVSNFMEEPCKTDSLNPSTGADASHVRDGWSISFLQLIDIVRGLAEDEFKFLLESRESTASADLGMRSLLERMKEELYITNSMKDIFHLQLSEHSDLQNEFDQLHHQLLQEISHLRTSFSVVQAKNDSLAEELADCRFKLDSVTSLKEKLESQLLAAESHVQEFSTRTTDLQLNLGKSQQDITSLMTELSETKGLLANLQAENETLGRIISSATDEQKNLVAEKDSRAHEIEKLLSELADCKSLVASFQVEIEKMNGTIGPLTDEKMKLAEEREHLLRETEKLQSELADCKNMVGVQEMENSNLRERIVLLTEKQKKLEEDNASLTHEAESVYLEMDAHKILVTALQSGYTDLREGHCLLTKERKKLEEEKEHLIGENNRLSAELIVLQERLSMEHMERTRLAADLEEALARLDKLTEENLFLDSSLEVHNAKMRETDNREVQLSTSVEIPVKHADSSEIQIRSNDNMTSADRHDVRVSHSVEEKPLVDGLPHMSAFEQLKDDVFVDFFEFAALKEHLERGEKILQNLEKAIEQIHTHTSSLSRSSSKVSAPAVSKLIQAFESKLQHDVHEPEETPLSEDQSTSDPFVSARGQIRSLKVVLEQLALDSRSSGIVFKGAHDGRIAAEEKLRELHDQLEYLNKHTDVLEADNIELGILCEAAKEHLFIVEEKNSELEVLYESLKQQEIRLRLENIELGEKLNLCLPRIDGIKSQLDSLQQGSGHIASSMHLQLEGLQEESERVLMLEQELASSVSQIVETVGRLDEHLLRFDPSISAGAHNVLDINSHVTASVDVAVKVIEDLERKLEAASASHETACASYQELNEKFNDLLEKNAMAIGILHNLYADLRKLVIDSSESVDASAADMQSKELLNPYEYGNYKNLTELVENFLSERLELQSINDKLNSELSSRIKDIEELNRRGLDFSLLQKLVAKLEGVVELEAAEINYSEAPASCLESLVSVLVQKVKEIAGQANLFRTELESKEKELRVSQENILQHKTEIYTLRESLNLTEESLLAARSQLQEKTSELEQSEQRLSSIREKLSIAVAKGKGLVMQRDNLKQSLVETSIGLERCSEELKTKDARLQELEAKLKTYSEAGERVEALESELSYIRHSATALRESFLLKDSLLQRIEEILEDLDLPEHFHSRDTLEKVEWLARSAAGNSLPLTDWDQKSSVGGSHSDAGFVVTDAWREDVQPSSNSVDDMRIKFDELQGKFYGLAEQNEMLEQSLVQRNNLVQRWEELLDRLNMPSQVQSMEVEDKIEWLGSALSEVTCDRDSLQGKIDDLENYCRSLVQRWEEQLDRLNMPSQVRSMEVEDKIEWLGSALSEVTRDRDSLQRKIDDLENYCSSLTTDLEMSQKQISDVNKDLQSVVDEKEHLSERLETLIFYHEKLSTRIAHLETENEKLQSEINDLHVKLAEKLGNEEHLRSIEGEMIRLKDLVNDAVQEHSFQHLALAGSSSESLEGLLGKLIEHYKTLASVKPVLAQEAGDNHSDVPFADPDSSRHIGSSDMEEVPTDGCQAEAIIANLDEAISRDISVIETQDVASLKKDLEEALHDLMLVKCERDIYKEKEQSLVAEVEALDKKRSELQELLNQEEQKSATVREKLNVAVRKGKSLVQQRDSLKQTIEEMSTELTRMKSEINLRENTLAGYEQKIRDLASYQESVKLVETDSNLLRNRLKETEYLLQERGNTLNLILSTLGNIDLGDDGNSSDPVEKLQQIGKMLQDMHSAMASAEQESRKSRRAAELLLAELNEVQERNDGLQEEISKYANELQQLSRQKDAAEAARIEALSHLEKLSVAQTEERRKQYSELMALRTSVNKLRNMFSVTNNSVAAVFCKELEFLHSLEANMELCMKQSDTNFIGWPQFGETSGNLETAYPMDSWSNVNLHDISSDSNIVDICGSVMTNLDEFMMDVGVLKEKVSKHSMSWNEQVAIVSKIMGAFFKSVGKGKDLEIASLHEKVALLYDSCSKIFLQIGNKKAELIGSDSVISLDEDDGNLSMESIKSMADRLSLAMNDFVMVNSDVVERNQKEMKTIIGNLQRELQEKDIQKDRICTELLNQIRGAEATAKNYATDLQSVSIRMHDLEKRLEVVEGERKSLEQRVEELQDGQASLAELKEKVRSLSDLLAAKEQEIEALMQALDEEEAQMADLTNKVKGLEQELQQKNTDLQNVEASRGKIAKKLSITVTKFDELHHLSENLLAEVEKLQQQLQDRDSEISFLRQEVTRCTNEVLVASQMSNKRDSDEIQVLFTWFDTIASLVGLEHLHPDDTNSQVHHYMEVLEKKITSMISELDEVRLVGQSKEALLEAERSKVAELRQREEALEKILHEKESQVNMATGSTSEIVEIEPVINKWTVTGTSIPSQVRSLRKGNNDQVAINIVPDHADDSNNLEEDDDKAHGFKSLSTSRIVPRFTRPVTDMVDGLWVSCDRTLMRQPALRLGIMIYWAILHALLATVIV